MYTSKEGLFSIGEMTKLCNSTKDTLYFYERKGLIKPCFIDDNGYRYYDEVNFYKFDMITSLRAADSSVSEIINFMSNVTPETYIEHLKNKQQYLIKKREELKALEWRIAQTIKLTEEGIDSNSQMPIIKNEDKEYLIAKHSEDTDDPHYYLETFSDVLLAVKKYNIPYDFHMSAYISKERLLDHNYKTDYFYVVSPCELHGNDICIKPSGEYLEYVHTGSYSRLTESYLVMMDFIEANRLTITGNSYEQTLIGWLNCSNINNYKTKISIQIKQDH